MSGQDRLRNSSWAVPLPRDRFRVPESKVLSPEVNWRRSCPTEAFRLSGRRGGQPRHLPANRERNPSSRSLVDGEMGGRSEWDLSPEGRKARPLGAVTTVVGAEKSNSAWQRKGDRMRIAFNVPRAWYLETRPGGEGHISGDGMLIANLFEALRNRGHELQIVSRVNVRDFWRRRLPARRLIAEAAVERGDMKRFSPDAWLIYNPTVQSPDLFGWWQHPKRYVILKGGEEVGTRTMAAVPRPWRDLYTYAYRKTLKRADWIEAIRPNAVRNLRAWGVPNERVCLLPRAVKIWPRI